MYDDVCTVLDRTTQDGCKGVVDDEEYVVTMGYFGYSVEVGDVAVGVAEGLGIDHLSVGADGCLECCQVIDFHDAVVHALSGQCVGNEIERTAIEVVCSHDVIAVLQHGLQRVGHSCSARGYSQTCYTALEVSDTIFEHTLGRVGQSAVDVAGVTQAETVGSML